MRVVKFLVICCAALAIAGCAKRGTVTPERTTGPADAGADTRAGRDATLDEGRPFGEETVDDEGDMLDQRVIYFDFDRSELRAEYSEVLSAHAAYLAENPGMTVRLEGHADERGSREYNIGLGERRSQAVRRVLMLQGSGTNQISTVSYGEERPAVPGSDEAAWAQNRRVEIVYQR